jgi:hypothetical protein
MTMGRNIPSISHRLDSKFSQWKKFAGLLSSREREAFLGLLSAVRNRRSAIDAADEADMGVAILLAMVVHLKGELDGIRSENRIPGP